jgi:hypothetical protein
MRIRRILTAMMWKCSCLGVARPSRWVCRPPVVPAGVPELNLEPS